MQSAHTVPRVPDQTCGEKESHDCEALLLSDWLAMHPEAIQASEIWMAVVGVHLHAQH